MQSLGWMCLLSKSRQKDFKENKLIIRIIAKR